jgi:hypothetical protein
VRTYLVGSMELPATISPQPMEGVWDSLHAVGRYLVHLIGAADILGPEERQRAVSVNAYSAANLVTQRGTVFSLFQTLYENLEGHQRVLAQPVLSQAIETSKEEGDQLTEAGHGVVNWKVADCGGDPVAGGLEQPKPQPRLKRKTRETSDAGSDGEEGTTSRRGGPTPDSVRLSQETGDISQGTRLRGAPTPHDAASGAPRIEQVNINDPNVPFSVTKAGIINEVNGFSGAAREERVRRMNALLRAWHPDQNSPLMQLKCHEIIVLLS